MLYKSCSNASSRKIKGWSLLKGQYLLSKELFLSYTGVRSVIQIRFPQIPQPFLWKNG